DGWPHGVAQVQGVYLAFQPQLADDDRAPPLRARHAVGPPAVILPFMDQAIQRLRLPEHVVEEAPAGARADGRILGHRGRSTNIKEAAPVARPANRCRGGLYGLAEIASRREVVHARLAEIGASP